MLLASLGLFPSLLSAVLISISINLTTNQKGAAMAKRKMLLMLVYSKLVKSGYYYNARLVLRYLSGLDRSQNAKDAVQFCLCYYDINPKEWANV